MTIAPLPEPEADARMAPSPRRPARLRLVREGAGSRPGSGTGVTPGSQTRPHVASPAERTGRTPVRRPGATVSCLAAQASSPAPPLRAVPARGPVVVPLPSTRPRRALAARRRRTVLGALVLGGCLAALSLPVSALAGAPAVPAGHPSGGAPAGTVYVLRAGDTLWSVAARFDRGGDPRPLAEALAHETGSAEVVPGERIVIP